MYCGSQGAFDRIVNEDSFVNLNAKDQVRQLKIAINQLTEAYEAAVEEGGGSWLRKCGAKTPFCKKYEEDIIKAHIKCITNCKEQPQKMALVR